jgi:hypothetical protein
MDGPRWTEEVDDLVDAGDVDGAIALLESVVSDLSTSAAPPATDLRLATALGDLAGLHASRGDTLRADELRARAIALRSRATVPGTGTLGFVSPPRRPCCSCSSLLEALRSGLMFQLLSYCSIGLLLELPSLGCSYIEIGIYRL